MNTQNTFQLWLTRFAWGLIGLNIVFSLVSSCVLIPNTLNTQLALWLNIFLALWLVGTSLVASTWLVIRYHVFFRTWIGWFIPFPIIFFTTSVTQGAVLIENASLFTLFSMMQIIGLWSMVPITIIRLLYKDVGLGFIGWGSLIMIWGFFFAWRFEGNLVEKFLLSLSATNQTPTLWWLNSIMCILWWIIPAGIAGFIGHTIRLLVREFQESKF